MVSMLPPRHALVTSALLAFVLVTSTSAQRIGCYISSTHAGMYDEYGSGLSVEKRSGLSLYSHEHDDACGSIVQTFATTSLL